MPQLQIPFVDSKISDGESFYFGEVPNVLAVKQPIMYPEEMENVYL
jgi:hypothetical protein